MPTKLKRYTVNLEPHLQALLEREAALNKRPVANQIIFNLEEFYEIKRREASLFKSPEGRQKEAPFFHTPRPQEPDSSLTVHESPGRDKT